MNVLRYCLVMFMVVGLLGGCCLSGGGSTKVHSTTTTKTTTTGQELTDLKKAYESGAITEEQYNKMKQQIIEKSGEK